ncbi:hypothetical protein MCACP_21680 [Neomoorella carbonis]
MERSLQLSGQHPHFLMYTIIIGLVYIIVKGFIFIT